MTDMPDGTVRIQGYCPMGCGQTLEVTEEGFIECSAVCPAPRAVADILADGETGHVVRFDSASETFNVKHPLSERIGGELLDCAIHSVVVEAIDMDLVDPVGSWRLSGRPPVYIPGGPDQEADWEWEPLG